MKLRYTRQAVTDLLAIADYVRERNASAAVDVETAIRSTIGLLADHPNMGRDRPGLDARAVTIPRYPYTAYYRIEGDEVWVVHIRDNRRKLPGRGDF